VNWRDQPSANPARFDGSAPGKQTDRPSTYGWVEKSLAALAGFGLKTPANPQPRFFARSAIHGLSDLQGSRAISDLWDPGPVDAQWAITLAAPARPTAQRSPGQAAAQNEPGRPGLVRGLSPRCEAFGHGALGV